MQVKPRPCLHPECKNLAQWVAINNIPTLGHVCLAHYEALTPPQVKQFYVRIRLV